MWEMFSHLRYQVVPVGRLMEPQTEESNDVREDLLLCLLQTLNGKCQITVQLEFKYIYVKAVKFIAFHIKGIYYHVWVTNATNSNYWHGHKFNY